MTAAIRGLQRVMPRFFLRTFTPRCIAEGRLRSEHIVGEPSSSGQSGEAAAEAAALAIKVAKLSHERSAADVRDRGNSGRNRPRSRWRSAVWWIALITAWSITLALATVALLRVFYHDGIYLLIWLNAFSRYLYLPAYACLAWAVWQRRWLLTLAASAVVFAHIAWMMPDFVRDRRFDVPAAASASTATGPSLRIFFANVYQINRQFEAMFDEIAAADPDVIVFAEWGWAWHAAFKQSPLSDVYSHGASMKHTNFGLVNIFSKRPLASESQSVVVGRLVRTADIELGNETLRLVAVHAPRPMYAPHEYEDYWDQLIPRLQSESSPLVVIGDYNATQHSRVYELLQAAGLRSAHDDRGRGYATTWPNDIYWLPPIRIDQAFLSPQVECERIVEGRGRGSDHRPLVLDVRIRDVRPAPPPAIGN